jgi:hypothetical protein
MTTPVARLSLERRLAAAFDCARVTQAALEGPTDGSGNLILIDHGIQCERDVVLIRDGCPDLSGAQARERRGPRTCAVARYMSRRPVTVTVTVTGTTTPRFA